jgi:hypothetical protein
MSRSSMRSPTCSEISRPLKLDIELYGYLRRQPQAGRLLYPKAGVGNTEVCVTWDRIAGAIVSFDVKSGSCLVVGNEVDEVGRGGA